LDLAKEFSSFSGSAPIGGQIKIAVLEPLAALKDSGLGDQDELGSALSPPAPFELVSPAMVELFGQIRNEAAALRRSLETVEVGI
jgi:hypothetical protein